MGGGGGLGPRAGRRAGTCPPSTAEAPDAEAGGTIPPHVGKVALGLV